MPICTRSVSKYSRRGPRCRQRVMSGIASAASNATNGSSAGATISMSPTESCPRLSDPTGSAHRIPGCPRSSLRNGSASAFAQLPAEDHVVELGVMLWKPSPELILSTDTLVGAGVNEKVLVVVEGRAAGETLGKKGAPVDAAIVGIIDSVDVQE